MGHDKSTHKARRYAPRRGPDILQLSFAVGILYIESLGEVLSEEVRGAALQSLAVLHQRLYGVGILRSGETFVGALASDDYRHAHIILDERLVYAYHFLCLGYRLFARFVSRMALLPQEFGRAQEQSGTHLPAHNVGPLVAQNRKVAVGLNPALVRIPDDCLGGRAHDELLFEFGIGVHDHSVSVGIVLQPIVRNHGALLGEPFDMIGLPAEKRFRDEKREVGVHMSCVLEHLVQRSLHLLPDCVSVRFDNHTAAHCRTLRKARLHNQIVIPLRIILLARGKLFQLICHKTIPFYIFQSKCKGIVFFCNYR